MCIIIFRRKGYYEQRAEIISIEVKLIGKHADKNV